MCTVTLNCSDGEIFDIMSEAKFTSRNPSTGMYGMIQPFIRMIVVTSLSCSFPGINNYEHITMVSLRVKEAVEAIQLAEIISKPSHSLLNCSQNLSSLVSYSTYRLGCDAILTFQVLLRFQMKTFLFLTGLG